MLNLYLENAEDVKEVDSASQALHLRNFEKEATYETMYT
jgi:hypothetical protein